MALDWERWRVVSRVASRDAEMADYSAAVVVVSKAVSMVDYLEVMREDRTAWTLVVRRDAYLVE